MRMTRCAALAVVGLACAVGLASPTEAQKPPANFELPKSEGSPGPVHKGM